MTDATPPAGAGVSSPRCGFVALVGAPNAGKSTLLNRMVGAKVAIVTPKVQTTRCRITAIAIEGDSQIVFLDTPGIFEPEKRLERAMVDSAWQGTADADVSVVLVDSAHKAAVRRSLPILDRLAAEERPVILVLNKIDRVRRDTLLALSASLNAGRSLEATYMISAETGDGVADLRCALAARVPAGPWLYPEDQLADLPMRLLAAEIVREKLMLRLHQELPYALTVETDGWDSFDDGSARISMTIYVRRASQKAIVLGHQGRQIKEIGRLAREELAGILDHPVHLFLFVKVQENWVEDRERYDAMGLTFN